MMRLINSSAWVLYCHMAKLEYHIYPFFKADSFEAIEAAFQVGEFTKVCQLYNYMALRSKQTWEECLLTLSRMGSHSFTWDRNNNIILNSIIELIFKPDSIFISLTTLIVDRAHSNYKQDLLTIL